MISEFDFKIRYIKGKENRVVDVLSGSVHVNHLEAMSSYGKIYKIGTCRQVSRMLGIWKLCTGCNKVLV